RRGQPPRATETGKRSVRGASSNRRGVSEKTCPDAAASVRLRRMGRLLAALVLAAVAMPAAGAPVRIFAVGHKQRLADAVTYQTKFPGQPFVRSLVLALTDTFYRSFYETFRDLAVTYGVHLAASVNAAPARRVDEADDAGLVALLRDPDEPTRTYAYEAVSALPHNTTFIFAPDGSVLVPDGNGGTLHAPAGTAGVLRGS